MSMHGSSLYKLSPFRYSTWKSIIREVHMLKDRGVDLLSHCHIRVGNGLCTQFWNEVWIGDTQLHVMFPQIYALEINKDCTVAHKLQFSVTSSLCRSVRVGVEYSQLALLQTKIPRTCSPVADWLQISYGSYIARGIYHGRLLVHMLIGLIGSIPSD
ncbi:hypothetical protein Tco_0543463 [Tanacetum coccineum]